MTHRTAAFGFIEPDTGLTILYSSAPSCGMLGVFSVGMLQSCERHFAPLPDIVGSLLSFGEM